VNHYTKVCYYNIPAYQLEMIVESDVACPPDVCGRLADFIGYSHVLGVELHDERSRVSRRIQVIDAAGHGLHGSSMDGSSMNGSNSSS